jgi:hypothetical protein
MLQQQMQTHQQAAAAHMAAAEAIAAGGAAAAAPAAAAAAAATSAAFNVTTEIPVINMPVLQAAKVGEDPKRGYVFASLKLGDRGHAHLWGY